MLPKDKKTDKVTTATQAQLLLGTLLLPLFRDGVFGYSTGEAVKVALRNMREDNYPGTIWVVTLMEGKVRTLQEAVMPAPLGPSRPRGSQANPPTPPSEGKGAQAPLELDWQRGN